MNCEEQLQAEITEINPFLPRLVLVFDHSNRNSRELMDHKVYKTWMSMIFFPCLSVLWYRVFSSKSCMDKQNTFLFSWAWKSHYLSGTTHTAQTDKWLLPEHRRKPFYKFIGWVKYIRAHGHIWIVSEKPGPKVTSTWDQGADVILLHRHPNMAGI